MIYCYQTYLDVITIFPFPPIFFIFIFIFTAFLFFLFLCMVSNMWLSSHH